MNLDKIEKLIIGNIMTDDGIETREVLMEDLKFVHWFKIRFVTDEASLLKLACDHMMGYKDDVQDCDNATLVEIVYLPD